VKPSIIAVILGLAPGTELRWNSGGWHAIRCPFHDDRAASASYNPTEQRFRCHACDLGGDGYDLIRQVEGVGFQGARIRAAEMCGSEFVAVDQPPQRSKLTARRTTGRAALVRKKYGRK
jgi:DNA primase